MATAPVITGAPRRAPSNVIPFPTNDVSRMQLRLAGCHNMRMFDRWEADFHKVKASLPDGDRGRLAASYVVERMKLEGSWLVTPETAA